MAHDVGARYIVVPGFDRHHRVPLRFHVRGVPINLLLDAYQTFETATTMKYAVLWMRFVLSLDALKEGLDAIWTEIRFTQIVMRLEFTKSIFEIGLESRQQTML